MLHLLGIKLMVSGHLPENYFVFSLFYFLFSRKGFCALGLKSWVRFNVRVRVRARVEIRVSENTFSIKRPFG